MTDSRKTADDAGPHDHDAAIAELLDFEPVPRKFKRPDGWSPALQRRFILHLAETGSPAAACEALGKNRHGVEKLYKSPDAASFRAAWDRAVEIAQEQAAERIARENAALAGVKSPMVDRRRKAPSPGPSDHPLPRGGKGLMCERLPVICDKCGAEGTAGDEAFSGIPDILAFEPVPRSAHDKLWPADTQRAFIAALAVSGSPVRAARSVGRHGFGAEKLRKARGARSFNEAWEAALDLARERELSRLHGSLTELGQKIDGRIEDEREGQVRNELGEWEDAASFERRGEEARASIFAKLQRLHRRMLVEEIIPDPEKRAAWIVLNGAEEVEAIENGTWTVEEWKGGEAET